MTIDQFEFSGAFDELTRSEEQQKQKNQSKIFPGHFFRSKKLSEATDFENFGTFFGDPII